MTPLPQRAARRGAATVLVLATAAGVVAPVLEGPASATPGKPGPAVQDARAIPFTDASLEPGDVAGTWTVRWSAPRAHLVAVHVGGDRGSIAARPVEVTHDAAGSVTFRSTSARPWVRLTTDRGASLEVTTRVLGLTGAPNFRDAGGYRTTDGRWVRYGVVYRSPALTLTGAELATASGLGITGDFDLRTTAEATATPDAALTGAAYVHLNVMGDATGATIPAVSSPEQAAGFMVAAERSFVDADTAKAAYRELFTHLATDEGASLFHCTAGKDRTGWANAVLLTLLGVPQETVMEDYLLSNTYYLNSPAVQAQLNALPASYRAIYERFMAVDASYLQAGLDRVAEEYGSMEAYAVEGLGLTPQLLEQLRDKLLVGAPTR